MKTEQMSMIKKMVLTGCCIALCIVLPYAFHMIPNGGTIFCPMHIPVLICGLACGWQYGMICGVSGVFLSSILTGMPPVAILPSMMVELAVYGLVTGILMKVIKIGKVYVDLYISLVVAMIVGRVVYGCVSAILLTNGGTSIVMWATVKFVTGLPGILLQLVLVPSIVFALMKAKVIPMKYNAKKNQ